MTQRLILRHFYGTEYEGCTHINPIIYESPEAFILDFEAAWLKADTEFKLAGEIFYKMHFSEYDKTSKTYKIEFPEILTIDEWFAEAQTI